MILYLRALTTSIYVWFAVCAVMLKALSIQTNMLAKQHDRFTGMQTSPLSGFEQRDVKQTVYEQLNNDFDNSRVFNYILFSLLTSGALRAMEEGGLMRNFYGTLGSTGEKPGSMELQPALHASRVSTISHLQRPQHPLR
jgi:hypothetical protein